MPLLRISEPSPESRQSFALLMDAIAIYKKSGNSKVPDDPGRGIDRFPQNDHRAIGVIRQMQHGCRASSAQRLAIAPQDDGLKNLEISSRQHHFPAALRQHIQCLLDFHARHPTGNTTIGPAAKALTTPAPATMKKPKKYPGGVTGHRPEAPELIEANLHKTYC